MKSLPKPLPCHQEWDKMEPVEGGRVCKACEKQVVDFRNMSWREIEQLQSGRSEMLCGIYDQDQLTHWGEEVPLFEACNSFRALAFMAAMTSALGAGAQQSATYQLRGTVRDTNAEVLIGVNVAISKELGTITNLEGEFSLVVPALTNYRMLPKLTINTTGYVSTEVLLSHEILKSGRIDITLEPLEQPSIIIHGFSVKANLEQKSKPSYLQKLRRRLRIWRLCFHTRS